MPKTWKDLRRTLFGTPKRTLITLVIAAALWFTGMASLMVLALADVLSALAVQIFAAFAPILLFIVLAVAAFSAPFKRSPFRSKSRK